MEQPVSLKNPIVGNVTIEDVVIGEIRNFGNTIYVLESPNDKATEEEKALLRFYITISRKAGGTAFNSPEHSLKDVLGMAWSEVFVINFRDLLENSTMVKESIVMLSRKELFGEIFSEEEIQKHIHLAQKSDNLRNYIGKEIVILKENCGWASVERGIVGTVSDNTEISFNSHVRDSSWTLVSGTEEAFIPVKDFGGTNPYFDMKVKAFERGFYLKKEFLKIGAREISLPLSKEVEKYREFVFEGDSRFIGRRSLIEKEEG